MKTLLLIIIGIIVVIALCTALWRFLHDLFKNGISKLIGGVLGLIIFYVGWKLLWLGAKPGEEAAVYQFYIDKHKHGRDSIRNRTADFGSYHQAPSDSKP